MNRPGFALTELIVAITLLALGLLTASGTAVLATRWLHQARAEEVAVGYAMAILDSLSAVSTPTGGTATIEGVEFRWTVGTQQAGKTVKISATYPSLSASQPLEFELHIPKVR